MKRVFEFGESLVAPRFGIVSRSRQGADPETGPRSCSKSSRGKKSCGGGSGRTDIDSAYQSHIRPIRSSQSFLFGIGSCAFKSFRNFYIVLIVHEAIE